MADDFLYDNFSNTPPPYRFQLFNPDTSQLITLVTEPLEWKEGSIEITRDIAVGGVFTQFVSDSLTFIKEGAAFIRQIWNEKEINGQCELIVSWFKFSEQRYIEMPSRFSLNFATIKPYVKVGNYSVGVLVETVKKSELVKLENRRDKEVDLTKIVIENGEPKIKTIGGAEIIDYTNLKKLINFPEILIQNNSSWVDDLTSVRKEIENYKAYNIYTQFQMTVSAADFIGSRNVKYKTSVTSYIQLDHFYQNPDDPITINFTYYIQIRVTNRKGNIFNPQNVYFIYLLKDNQPTNIELGRCGARKGTFTFSGTQEIEVLKNEKLYVYIRTSDVDNVDAHIITSNFRLTKTISSIPARTIEGMGIYEAFERNLQMIMDSQFPFYSEFFGRTDTIYNANGNVYPSENQLRFSNIMTGLHLQGATLNDQNAPLPVTFDTLFQSVNCRHNIGYELEFRDNFYRIRIENYDYFFQDVEVLDLSGRLTRYDIEMEVMPELAYSAFETGYEDYEYEVFNGRGEYNTDNKRTSIINVETVFDNKSEIRGDTIAIFEKLADELTTKDSKEDNELFIIKTQRDGIDWKPEFEENITVEENTSLYGGQSLNLYFTPTRNLLRHGNRIKGAFLKYLSSFLRFQNAGKLQTLKTTGEGYTITENEDIPVNNLDFPIFKPIKYIASCKFTYSDFETLMSNPKGYITFSPEIKGYLLSLKKKNAEDKAIIEIIEKA